MSVRGFEPRTTWLKVKCSTDWANTPRKNAQNRNRTSDTRIFSPLLYQLSYLGILDLNFHSDLSSGDRIWTYDLRVMSPTSFQTAPPRDIMLYMICFPFQKYSWKRKWMEVDSNHRSKLQQIYSLSPLATRESIHIHFSMNKADDRTRTDNLLITNQLLCQLSHIGISMGPIGLEPMTLCL